MSEQSKAQRLAEMIERYNAGVLSQAIVEDYTRAAAELRRLDALVGELVEALKTCEYVNDCGFWIQEYDSIKVSAALAKAQENGNG